MEKCRLKCFSRVQTASRSGGSISVQIRDTLFVARFKGICAAEQVKLFLCAEFAEGADLFLAQPVQRPFPHTFTVIDGEAGIV